MSNDDRRDGAPERDHPQTINLESDARGSAGGEAQPDEGRVGADGDDEESDAQAELSEGDAEAVRRHASGGRSMGDAVGSSAGLDVGSGTGGDKGDLGGGGSAPGR